MNSYDYIYNATNFAAEVTRFLAKKDYYDILNDDDSRRYRDELAHAILLRIERMEVLNETLDFEVLLKTEVRKFAAEHNLEIKDSHLEHISSLAKKHGDELKSISLDTSSRIADYIESVVSYTREMVASEYPESDEMDLRRNYLILADSIGNLTANDERDVGNKDEAHFMAAAEEHTKIAIADFLVASKLEGNPLSAQTAVGEWKMFDAQGLLEDDCLQQNPKINELRGNILTALFELGDEAFQDEPKDILSPTQRKLANRLEPISMALLGKQTVDGDVIEYAMYLAKAIPDFANMNEFIGNSLRPNTQGTVIIYNALETLIRDGDVPEEMRAVTKQLLASKIYMPKLLEAVKEAIKEINPDIQLPPRS